MLMVLFVKRQGINGINDILSFVTVCLNIVIIVSFCVVQVDSCNIQLVEIWLIRLFLITIRK